MISNDKRKQAQKIAYVAWDEWGWCYHVMRLIEETDKFYDALSEEDFHRYQGFSKEKWLEMREALTEGLTNKIKNVKNREGE